MQPPNTPKTTSSNCKIPPSACFINTSHLSTGLPTEDYGELLECHLCFPEHRGGFYCCQTWGTKESAQIRHLHTKHGGTGEGEGGGGGPPIRKELRRALWCGNAEVRNSQALSRLADQDLSDLGSTRVWVNIIILFMEPYELISETNIDST